ncbi:MAG TPA: hypothetical protein VFV81_02605, partial [Verrucomicrobiae bacterium]|nr:hypothetical protein [Verrucomicrobiae bacterium]
MSKRPAARAPLPPSGRGWIPAVCLGLAALTLAVYWQTFQFRFVDLDDQLYITDNPSITNGVTLPGVAAAFDYRSSDNWVPLTTLSHMLDCQLFGLQPGWPHGVNVVLHLFSAVLLFLVLRQMTGALWPPAFVATLFAIHPLHVESVAWVSERKDTLSGVFFMLTLALYVRYARRPKSWVNYLMVLAVFGIGLLAKPMLITVPLVLLLLDYWPLKRFADASIPGVTPFSRLKMLPVPVQLFAEKIPLMLVAAADGVLTLLAEKRGIQPLNAFPLPARIENALISYVTQAAKMFWPANLAPFYPFPAAFPIWLIAGALAFLVSTSAWAWLERRRRPYLLTGWLWYLVMLLPVIGFVQVGLQSMADRHTYLPQIGLYLIVAFGVSDLAARWRHRRFRLGAAAGIAIVVLAVLAGRQASWWQNNRLLWTRAVACQPESAFAHYNLGN